MKGLILNADDFGPSPFINRGIIKGIEYGVVNSVSAIVTFGDESNDQIYNLQKRYGDHIAIGLHLSITAGRPVHRPLEEVSSLLNRKFNGEDKWMWQLRNIHFKNIDLDELELELKAQIELLGQILGGVEYIDHINVHHNILNFYYPFWKKLHPLLEKYNAPYRNPLSAKHKNKIPGLSATGLLPIEKYAFKTGLPRIIRNPQSFVMLMSALKKEQLLKVESEALDSKIKMPDYVITQYYGQPSPQNIESILQNIGENEIVDFMLHLGDINDREENLPGIDHRYYPIRELELQHLISSKILERMDHYNIELRRYPRG